MIDIAEKVIDKVAASRRIWPARSNRASEIGHECERYLYYARAKWQERELPDPTLQFIFTGGQLIEDMAERELKDAGFNIVETQRPFDWPEYDITGTIDCRIEVDGHLRPLEVKGLNHREWEKLNSVEDMLNSKAPWVRRYPAQLLTYMMMTEQEWGIFYLKSKATFVPKVIWVSIWEYLGYMEALLLRIELVNTCLKEGVLPDRVDYDEKLCGFCPFFRTCGPDAALGDGLTIEQDQHFAMALDRWHELKPLAKEWKELDDGIKQRVKGCDRTVCGSFFIRGKWVHVERKPSPATSYDYWKSKIERLGPADEQPDEAGPDGA